MRQTKTLKALSAVVSALSELDPESRRRVIEAVHALLPISAGRGGEDAPAPPARGRRR
jgi:hypothetical protein